MTIIFANYFAKENGISLQNELKVQTILHNINERFTRAIFRDN